jgi:hypothetical protein
MVLHSVEEKRQSTSSPGRWRALVIGVADYQRFESLPCAVRNNATTLRKVLVSPQCGYPEEGVHLLLDQQATSNEIRAALDRLADEQDLDTILIYITTHGWRVESSATYLLVYNTDLDDLENTAISASELTQKLAALNTKKLVVILDCCYAAGLVELNGASLAPARLAIGLDEHALSQLVEGEGRVILSSSKASEASLILEGDPYSLFTKYFLRGLQGEASVGGEVRFGSLVDYVAKRVTREARQAHRTQTVIFDAKKATSLVLAYVPPLVTPPSWRSEADPILSPPSASDDNSATQNQLNGPGALRKDEEQPVSRHPGSGSHPPRRHRKWLAAVGLLVIAIAGIVARQKLQPPLDNPFIVQTPSEVQSVQIRCREQVFACPLDPEHDIEGSNFFKCAQHAGVTCSLILTTTNEAKRCYFAIEDCSREPAPHICKRSCATS